MGGEDEGYGGGGNSRRIENGTTVSFDGVGVGTAMPPPHHAPKHHRKGGYLNLEDVDVDEGDVELGDNVAPAGGGHRTKKSYVGLDGGDATEGEVEAERLGAAPDGSDETSGRLAIFGILNLGYVVLQLLGAMAFGSLALMSDGFHNLSDVAAIGMAMYIHKLQRRRCPENAPGGNDSHPYGYKRAEVIGGLINSVALVSLSAYIILNALPRLVEPTKVRSGWSYIILAFGGVLVNLVGVLFFLTAGQDGPDPCGVFLHAHSHSHEHGHEQQPEVLDSMGLLTLVDPDDKTYSAGFSPPTGVGEGGGEEEEEVSVVLAGPEPIGRIDLKKSVVARKEAFLLGTGGGGMVGDVDSDAAVAQEDAWVGGGGHGHSHDHGHRDTAVVSSHQHHRHHRTGNCSSSNGHINSSSGSSSSTDMKDDSSSHHAHANMNNGGHSCNGHHDNDHRHLATTTTTATERFGAHTHHRNTSMSAATSSATAAATAPAIFSGNHNHGQAAVCDAGGEGHGGHHSHEHHLHDHHHEEEDGGAGGCSHGKGHVHEDGEEGGVCDGGHGHTHGHTHAHGKSMNLWAVLVHAIADAISSGIVCVQGAVIYAFGSPGRVGWTDYLDPITSICLSVFIVYCALPVIKECSHVLLEGTPRKADIPRLRRELLEIRGVSAVKGVSVIQLNSEELFVGAVTLVVVIADENGSTTTTTTTTEGGRREAGVAGRGGDKIRRSVKTASAASATAVLGSAKRILAAHRVGRSSVEIELVQAEEEQRVSAEEAEKTPPKKGVNHEHDDHHHHNDHDNHHDHDNHLDERNDRSGRQHAAENGGKAPEATSALLAVDGLGDDEHESCDHSHGHGGHSNGTNGNGGQVDHREVPNGAPLEHDLHQGRGHDHGHSHGLASGTHKAAPLAPLAPSAPSFDLV